MTMTGRDAYMADLKTCPLYHDGKPRPLWGTLCAVSRLSWERKPVPRNLYPATGTFYRLPQGLTWERVAALRAVWDIAPNFAPLGGANGVMSWGTLLPSNFEKVTQ